MTVANTSSTGPSNAPAHAIPDDELLPLRDLGASDWLLRALFVVLVLVGVASQLSQEITEWLYGAPTQSAK